MRLAAAALVLLLASPLAACGGSNKPDPEKCKSEFLISAKAALNASSSADDFKERMGSMKAEKDAPSCIGLDRATLDNIKNAVTVELGPLIVERALVWTLGEK